MADTNWLEQAVLQWMSNSATPWKIDSEMGNLQEDILGNGQPLISYLRYDVFFDVKWMKDNLDMVMSQQEVNGLEKMDAPDNVKLLSEVGKKAAKVQIKPEHLPVAFDLK